MARSTAKRRVNKAQFVRSLPAAMPAKDVVTKAAAAGIKVSEKYVYNTRSSARGKGSPEKRRVSVRVASVAGGGTDTRFRKLVLSLGLERANALMAEVERTLHALIAAG